MVGPTFLRSKKSLVTRYTNNLNRVLEEAEAFQGSSTHDSSRSTRADALIIDLNASAGILGNALNEFTDALDTIENLPEEQAKQTDEYVESSLAILDRAQRLVIELEKGKLGVEIQNTPVTLTQAPNAYLPAIPIPTFTGKIGDFTNFWTLYEANVHSQPFSKLIKFNYLINALRGSARELVKRFPISEANYDHAVQLLRDKYGNQSALINELQSRLETVKAQNQTISAQRNLLEQILPVVTQLEELDVSLNGSFLTRKLLAKFSPELQRKVLSIYLPLNKRDSDWVMKNILCTLDNFITMEEQILDAVDQPSYSNLGHRKNLYNNNIRGAPSKINAPDKRSSGCMFCDSLQHKSSDCMKVTNIAARRSLMQRQNKCLNCGKEGHWIKDCSSDGCRNCKGLKHHHTLCPKRQGDRITQSTPGVREEKQHTTPYQGKSPHTAPDTQKQTVKSQRSGHRVKAHPVLVEPNLVEKQGRSEAIRETLQEMTFQNNVTESNSGRVLLLTGTARVRDEGRGIWKEVEILFDTGADQSFITLALANELGLTCTQQEEFLMYTFGTEKPISTTCGSTTLDIWDQEGRKHGVRLYTTPVLTGKGQTTQLTQEDLAFVSRHNIRLSQSKEKTTSKPQILLGCDQLWELLEAPLPRLRLPSGLQLIPSKLGYLLTGKQQSLQEGAVKESNVHAYVVSVINTDADLEDDITRWDRYWTMDSAGVCEFTGTKNAEKASVNAQVETFFKNTIERRQDGYYVRFPYKDDHPPLPDNRMIALKRLQGVVNMLQTKPSLFDDYDNTFQTQLEKGIIEEIPNNQPGEGPVLHYIPHQPVLTPHKETTKLRIVFDASSHYKNCPSLNDILHQGPTVLPDLYAMVLRFRLLPYSATADVEKAFLQVRLHELDRDATRVLWIKDINRPIIDDNIVTYRFTRVTFGLNVSPFLLAGTIYHHLANGVTDQHLAQEIRENLYVDNLILSANTQEDLTRKVIASRQIFADMNMNLREFLANEVDLKSILAEDACAKSDKQKVLGIQWNATEDKLHIACKLEIVENPSKRIVARQLASVYDPLGWLVPLLTPVKHFQQALWKQGLDWDTVLPQEFKDTWNKLVLEAGDFQCDIPRRLLQKGNQYNLAVFADASDIAMATCAYAFTEKHSALVMAKCKLPSIKTVTTIPKLEMNALTMATRLAWSVYQAIIRRLTSTPYTLNDIFIFSDSQIALGWLSRSSNKSNPGVLVSNRLTEIRRIVDAFKQEDITVRFAYVNTKENPADAGTRGLTREQLQGHSWWSGPEFLRNPISTWTTTFYDCDLDESGELIQETTMNVMTSQTEVNESSWVDLKRFSSLTRAKRVTALALIFVKKVLGRLSEESQRRIWRSIPELRVVSGASKSLQATDIRAARISLIRHHQLTHVAKSYRKSMENSLRLFMDPDGLWRSKGRLGCSDLGDAAKSPILVAPNTDLARLIIQEAHENYHQGTEHTISTIRQEYWIPKIRQAVRKVIQRCVKCRRFNGLPYKYPDSTHLPERRVVRSHPFQHIGLDFFDLPSNSQSDTQCYGCIFTCTVTRLIHLEMVQSMNTIDFLNALRRFVARRGVPDSITCDNAPTFLLSSTILSDDSRRNEFKAEIQDVFASKEIQWRHITPYAPWQGGFYERLIKSVKHALYKALRGSAQRSGDHLRTVLTEVEACLNSRPLTYQGATQEEFSSIRPIDFIQKGISLTIPLDTDREIGGDTDYLPPEELRMLRTRIEVLDALKSSCETTDMFWKIWQEQYLTSLREKHKKTLTSQRHAQRIPTVGDVVLLCDPVLPRNSWRMARITGTRSGTDAAIREVELVTGTHRKIRRPVNLLIPLEISSHLEDSGGFDSAITDDKENAERGPQDTPRDSVEPRYNLRPRKTVNTVEKKADSEAIRKPRPYSSKWFLFHIMLLSLLIPTCTTTATNVRLTCAPSGALIHIPENETIQVCAETLCTLHKTHTNPFLVKFPAHIILHDYVVTLKWEVGEQLAVMETTCARQNFCQQLDCWWCAATLFNPECRPVAAITIVAVILYSSVALCYVLLYVPITIGKPFRLILSMTVRLVCKVLRTLRHIAYLLIRFLAYCIRNNRARSRRERILAALAIIIAATVDQVHTCQHVDVLEHHQTTCFHNGTHEACRVALNELMKINTYHREACLRLTKNSTLIANVKLRWKGLYLRCEHSTKYFTRATRLRQISSKRCPLMGSCINNKCEGVNASTLIEELKEGNNFPGRTGCMESCGGLGCGCVLPSAGCLFFRVYALPKSERIYEIFECVRWTKEIKLNMTIENAEDFKGTRSYILSLIPNVPKKLPLLTITMTDVSLPPTPALSDEFITDGTDIAIWRNHVKPSLICSTAERAQQMKCLFQDDCVCVGAENSAKCTCSDHDLEEEFRQISNKLPVKTTAWEMSKRSDNSVIAKIPHMVSADFTVELNQTIDMSTQLVTSGRCHVTNSEVEGCYHCSKGAQAKISCYSTNTVLGEILCNQQAFLVPCGPTSVQSTLLFHLDSAQQFINCSVRCGEELNYFTLTGILKYTHDFHETLKIMLEGNSTNFHELKLPDFFHIAEVVGSWYKTLLFSLLGVTIALFISYMLLQSLGLRLIWGLIKGFLKLACYPFRVTLFLHRKIHRLHAQKKTHEKYL